MKKKLKAAISITLASLFLSFPVYKAEACGPVFPSAVIINWTHPDMPLKLFAQGNIGVVQPSWARSYMCVAYRYLNNAPLNEKEQESIVRLWHKRLGEVDFFAEGTYTDPLDKYLKVRAKAMGMTDKEYYQVYSPASSYGTEQRIVGSAYDTARITLEERISKFGPKSPQVKEWIKGQDHVFGIGFDKEKSIPPALGADADPLIRADRDYQIAAANFYLKKYGEAAKIFEQIGKDKNSPWSKWAPYLVARCKVNSACDGGDYSSYDDARATVKALLNAETNKDKRQDYVDFLGRLDATEARPGDILDKLTPAISKGHNEAYGHDVGDVTVLMDKIYYEGNSEDEDKTKSTYDFSKHDLLDWIDTFQRPFDYLYSASVEEKKKEQAKYSASAQKALTKWRKTKSNPWLVAAVSANSLSNPANKDLLDAALSLPSSNPAYLTANFYAIDALIAQKKTAEARKRIQNILAMKNLPPTTQNMYKAQLMAVANSTSEYLQASCFNFPTESDNNLYLPANWIKVEKQDNFNIASSGWDGMVSDDLNRNLPLSKLIELCKDNSLPLDFRKKLTACAWIKAQTLNSPESAKQLSGNFSAYYPALASMIKACDAATNATTRQVLLAKLMNKAYGATPYLQGGVPRMGSAMTEFNWYHNNYWLPLPLKVETKTSDDGEGWEWPQVVAPGNDTIHTMMKSYYKPGISKLLTPQEKGAAAKELLTMYNNHPSKLLGEAVIRYSQSNPKDADAPELLHLIVKLPKWSGSSPVGSDYSKKAFKVLHANFKGSKWAKKATCWY